MERAVKREVVVEERVCVVAVGVVIAAVVVKSKSIEEPYDVMEG